MNRGQFSTLSALVMFLNEANSRYEAREKRSGIESLIADLADGLEIDVEFSKGSDGFKSWKRIKGLSSATKTRALNDLVDLGIFVKKNGRYRLSDDSKPENLLKGLGDGNGA